MKLYESKKNPKGGSAKVRREHLMIMCEVVRRAVMCLYEDCMPSTGIIINRLHIAESLWLTIKKKKKKIPACPV